jgi:hypothetical protein
MLLTAWLCSTSTSQAATRKTGYLPCGYVRLLKLLTRRVGSHFRRPRASSVFLRLRTRSLVRVTTVRRSVKSETMMERTTVRVQIAYDYLRHFARRHRARLGRRHVGWRRTRRGANSVAGTTSREPRAAARSVNNTMTAIQLT